MGASGSVIQQLNDVINEPGFFFSSFHFTSYSILACPHDLVVLVVPRWLPQFQTYQLELSMDKMRKITLLCFFLRVKKSFPEASFPHIPGHICVPYPYLNQ